MTSYTWLTPKTEDVLQDFYAELNERLNDEDKQRFEALLSAENSELLNQQFTFVLQCSLFVRKELLRRPALVFELIQPRAEEQVNSSPIFDDCWHLGYADSLANHGVRDEADFDRFLRVFRAQVMTRIILRDFNRLADCSQTTTDLSYLARASLNAALAFHYERLCQKHGVPRNAEGEQQPLMILGMGKLGAHELNLSSDIDLIFTYPEKGNTDGSEKPLSNQEFFSRLGKKIIRSLDFVTAEGFVFRVDMRLRPYGQSGALVSSFDALEEYYQTQGREWERYAMVKADIVASNEPSEANHAQTLMAMLRGFTYRKYVDFSVIEALRELKKMIVQEVKRRRLDDDIKLGAGGIREVEFVTQVFQLIRGGREPELQDNRLMVILPMLAQLKCLPEDTVEQLSKAYIFLRNVEHGIQGYNDEQTQQLPSSEHAQQALCKVMACQDWPEFMAQLHVHRENVKAIFAEVIASPADEQSHANALVDDEVWESTEAEGKVCILDPELWASVWRSGLDDQSVIEQMTACGHEDAALSWKLVHELWEWASNAAMHNVSRDRLDTFMPLLLTQVQRLDRPSETLQRTVKLIKSVARRSAYLLLLIENPQALAHLLRLTEASPWIGDRLAEHPALLDELLSPETLYTPPKNTELRAELTRLTLRIDENDLEGQMEALRYFRSAHTLKVAASEISGALPLMKVSDYLTWMAEAILEHVLMLTWGEMVRKHGYPDGEVLDKPGFIIVGYGKLGGIELGHGSDLDMVFIHNASANGMTAATQDGQRSLDNQTFYMRMGQKIIHFLTTNMPSGDLYEVDMRLRPSGNSGMLVASLNSFEKYQQSSAWTWEHQALVRARVIAGSEDLAAEFERVRRETLLRQRDVEVLRSEVIEMRHKMREHLGSKSKGGMGLESEQKHNQKQDIDAHKKDDAAQDQIFHLKHDAGGIVDIEFMVQYGVLAWGYSHPELATFTDNIRILESFANSNLLTAQEVDQLTKAYKAFRAAGHRLTLQQQASVVDAGQFVSERQTVIAIWQRLMGDA